MTPPMSIALILALTVNAAASHALLKRSLDGVALPAAATDVARLAGHCLGSPLVWCALSMQVRGCALGKFVISRERLAVATAISGSFFYLLTAVLGWICFNERRSHPQLSGLGLITAGVVLRAMS